MGMNNKIVGNRLKMLNRFFESWVKEMPFWVNCLKKHAFFNKS